MRGQRAAANTNKKAEKATYINEKGEAAANANEKATAATNPNEKSPATDVLGLFKLVLCIR